MAPRPTQRPKTLMLGPGPRARSGSVWLLPRPRMVLATAVRESVPSAQIQSRRDFTKRWFGFIGEHDRSSANRLQNKDTRDHVQPVEGTRTYSVSPSDEAGAWVPPYPNRGALALMDAVTVCGRSLPWAAASLGQALSDGTASRHQLGYKLKSCARLCLASCLDGAIPFPQLL